MKYLRGIALVSALVMVIAAAPAAQPPAHPSPWTFAVMSDTQWIGADDGYNPGTVAVSIVKALNERFVRHHVKFVVQVGDLADSTGSTPQSVRNAEGVRAAFAQELYNAGIGFFPVRGNHDANNLAGYEFESLYPQTRDGSMNATPPYVFDGTVVNPDAGAQPFPVPDHRRHPFVMGSHFSTPDPGTTGGRNWTGLSYSFDFRNARFVLIDQFTPLQASPASTVSQNPAPDAIKLQQPWIDAVLAGRPASGHVFVFSHKGLITENHVDTVFGSTPAADPATQDRFITSLYENDVRYFIQGHDHMHDRSLVSVTTGSPTDAGIARVQNLLCASDSSKFYTPGLPSNDEKYDVPAFGHTRQAQIAQELHTIGYYLFTVDGPRVTVEYYSASLDGYVAPDSCSGANCEWLIHATPALDFARAETFGYSLNGREFLVRQAGSAPISDVGESYTVVHDTFEGTTAQILGGENESAAQDFDGRRFIKTVDTGWAEAGSEHLASHVLTLWGMADLHSDRTDVYTLSMSYDDRRARSWHPGTGGFGLATKDADGEWVNAVERNVGGGAAHFVVGPWKPAYGLGTYGIDPATHTAWAVVNHDGNFAVVRNMEPEWGHRR